MTRLLAFNKTYFNKTYFTLTILIFIIEIIIGVFVHDRFIRPYIGDVLVVILIYCFLKSFLNIPILPTAMGVLGFSFIVEFLQYFNIVGILGLQDVKLARIIIGTAFAWTDMLAYIAGFLVIIGTEKALAVEV